MLKLGFANSKPSAQLVVFFCHVRVRNIQIRETMKSSRAPRLDLRFQCSKTLHFHSQA